jgi:phosphate uptake regulator
MEREKNVFKRRIWRIKGGSYITSLPKDWVEKDKLEEIYIIEDFDGNLKIINPLTEKEKHVIIEVEKFKDPSTLEYSVLTSYMQGADKISVISKDVIDLNIKKRLRDLKNELIGADIIQDKSDSIVYQILLDISAYPINDTIIGFNSFISDIHNDTVVAVKEYNKRLANEILDRVKDGVRKYRFMIRQIAIASQNVPIAKKIGINNYRHTIIYGVVASHLNRILHHTAAVNNHLLRIEAKDDVANDYIIRMAEHASRMRDDSVNALVKKDITLATNVIKLMGIQRNLEEELLNYLFTGKVSQRNAVSYSMMGREFRRVSGYAVGISDAVGNLVLVP